MRYRSLAALAVGVVTLFGMLLVAAPAEAATGGGCGGWAYTSPPIDGTTKGKACIYAQGSTEHTYGWLDFYTAGWTSCNATIALWGYFSSSTPTRYGYSSYNCKVPANTYAKGWLPLYNPSVNWRTGLEMWAVLDLTGVRNGVTIRIHAGSPHQRT